jgi:hypothetical protein
MRTHDAARTGSTPGRPSLPGLTLLLGLLTACAGAEPPGAAPLALGPLDGRDLPPADTGRVALGDLAPDFTLASLDDGVITLSDYRGEKDVILVFYRGHW